MNFRTKLCEEIKNYNKVIVYGYGDVGLCLLDYIIEFETSIKLANYSGRIKFFAHSSKNEAARAEKKGIPIKRIWDLSEYAETALVIIATTERHHASITEILDELGFQNRLYITHEAYCELRESVANHRELTDNRVLQYHMNHQIKLDRVVRKARTGKKIKVFFMVHDAAVFGLRSVYKCMEADELFEPYVYMISRQDVVDPEFYEKVLKHAAFFEERGYRVIVGYDSDKNPLDMHGLNPDILFYDLPKLHGDGWLYYNRLEHLSWEYLTCYVPYGLLMVDSFYYHYHTMAIRETWKFFLDTMSSFKRVLVDGAFNGFNTILSGYPKFDDYYEDYSDEELPSKLQNSNKTVIYAPHHSLFISNNFGTFDLYKDVMMDVVKANPDINFVFKPHPLLEYRITRLSGSEKLGFTYEDYLNYIKEWESLPNGVCVTQGDYINIFRRSSCMITDCGSFIGEYLPSLNPCIYLFNPRKEGQEDVYTTLAKDILDTYYIAKTKEELEKYINNVAIDGEDSKRQEREVLFNKEFKNIGHAGAFITNYLKDLITQ